MIFFKKIELEKLGKMYLRKIYTINFRKIQKVLNSI